MDIKIDENLWSSYFPALWAAVGATTGPVLELGIGDLSTPSLHALCGAQGRELVSVEDNKEWFDRFATKYFNNLHRIIHSEYLEFLPYLVERNWGVSFIDSSPGGKMRAELFKALIPVSDFVVCHDFWQENEEHISPLLKGLNYHVTSTYRPPTLIASRKLNVPESIRCI